MLYEFRSRATGTVTMVGKSAEQVLQIIGKPVEPTGIITVAQIPAAISALVTAAEREQPPAETQTEEGDEESREALGANFVSLRQRVYPLIELMREARAADGGRDLGALSPWSETRSGKTHSPDARGQRGCCTPAGRAGKTALFRLYACTPVRFNLMQAQDACHWTVSWTHSSPRWPAVRRIPVRATVPDRPVLRTGSACIFTPCSHRAT